MGQVMLHQSRFFLLLVMLGLLAACASGPRIDTRHASSGHDSRVQYIILHYTASDLSRSLALLSGNQVSSHYLIANDRPATIYRLVDEQRRAWHAGESQWQGRTWLNGSSIGIEIVNRGYRDTEQGRLWYPFDEAQIDALIPLLKDIMARHGIKPEHVLAHSDIAPLRKVDPGPLFPWQRLAAAGLVRWPDAAAVRQEQQRLGSEVPSVAWFQQQLVQLGYGLNESATLDEATRKVIAAFQMKYRPQRFDGFPDTETAAILRVLNGPAD